MTTKTTETPTTLISTMDGEQVAAESALCLNWARVLACKFAAAPSLRPSIQGILNGIRMHPMNFAVSNLDTAKVQKLTELLEGVRVRGGNPPPLWVPYLEALGNWAARQPKAEPTATPAKEPATKSPALKAADERAKAARDRARQRIQAEQKKADELGEFIPESVKAQRVEAEARRNADQTKRAQLAELIGPFAMGQAYVNSNRRPSSLRLNGMSLKVTFVEDLLTYCEENNLDPKYLSVQCAFCGEEHTLAELVSLPVKGGERGETKDAFVVRQIYLPALTEDKTSLNVYLEGHKREGQPKKLPVIVCRQCSSLAFQAAKDQPDLMKVWPADLWPRLAEKKAERDEDLASSNSNQRKAGTALKANLGERTGRR